MGKNITAAFLFAALTGCASVSEVIPAGKDTYTVSSEMGGQFPSWSDVKQLSLKRANKYCIDLNKNMVPVKWDTHGSRGWSPLNAELTFECLASDDPDYKRGATPLTQ